MIGDEEFWNKVRDELAKLGVRDFYRKTLETLGKLLERSRQQTTEAQIRSDEVKKLLKKIRNGDEIVEENYRLKKQVLQLQQDLLSAKHKNAELSSKNEKLFIQNRNYKMNMDTFMLQIKNSEGLLVHIKERIELHQKNPQGKPEPGKDGEQRLAD